ncbi:hypothetical protein PHYSODRAFT_303139 [Phytophthora sojae]|uniref:RxLR effector protein n=1 Tax=Phytophthora sojae (strain P6497) TaxID=1094619 RepID=G4ZV85_PHYSP|nr:hypothetical protein PHYSODRAFT_303139 [Phytophthora sojae]EGZ13709.1 hypothetical protein PHYSODRAFT_303139 [Phytophthora sojae]|eukprot:XP_009531138.1 hypothetical protein PHYSODRAFT_303139 [Phytophthora sojae]
MATLFSPKFRMWEKYLDGFNERYPEKKAAMIDRFTYNYDDPALLWMFHAGTSNPSTEELATNLQSALITKWIAEKKDPTDLKLKLNCVPTSDEMIERYVKALSKNTN